MRIAFTIYGEPKGKGRPRFFRRGNFVGTYTPDKTRQAEQSVLGQALAHKPEAPISGPISVSIKFYMPIPKSKSKAWRVLASEELLGVIKKPDLDNLIKSILDPLNTVFWDDDSQIFRIDAVKYYSVKPRVEVTIISEEVMR